MRVFLRNFFIKYIYFSFRLLVKRTIKNKVVMPHKVIDEIYEIFDNVNKNQVFQKKIIVPYEDITELNRINIYRPYEILEAKTLLKKSQLDLNIETTKEFILPLAILDLNSSEKGNDHIKLSYNNVEVDLELKYKNRFHYLPIKSDNYCEKIQIESDRRDIAIGKPIYKDKKPLEAKPKLIVHIFVDAFTQCIVDQFGYEIIPNTRNFFSNGGTFYTNAYAQSEWTLSSIAGVFTGKYTNEHLLYHPRREDKIKETTIADVLSEEGYRTFSCTNVPRLTAVNGFDKGFDRSIVALDKDYNYIINEACEQLDAFGGNQYQFLGFFDLHEAHRLQPVSSQSINNIKDFNFKHYPRGSKDTSIVFDEEQINMYKNSITHFDKKIQRLYDAINSYDKEAMVILHSDHGVSFMGKTTELLAQEREKIVFLYKNNKESKIDNNIKEIRELPSMICRDLKIKDSFNHKYEGYAITESIYPNKEYEIVVRDKISALFFKISWEDLIKRNTEDYQYSSSYHPLDNETLLLKEDDNYKKSILIAKNHYLTMCKTISVKGL